MDIQVYYGPITEEEKRLKLQLAELERQYRDAAQPFIDRLVAIHALKVPVYVLWQDAPNKAVS